MGQLCCFPFSRDEEKISAKNGGEPDDAELLRLSKRLVENAVLKAVQQYLEETQSRGKRPIGLRDLIREALRQERMGLKSKVKQIKELLLKPETQARIRRELLEGRPASSWPGGDPGDQVLQAPPRTPGPEHGHATGHDRSARS